MPAPLHLPAEALEALRHGWGYDGFRPMQAEAVAAAMGGRDALVILPTGGGKSLCYQVPAACGKLVVVVSPLIALMDDQVAGAREAGLRAGALHSNLDERERTRVRTALAAGELDLIYVSPERLLVGDLAGRLARAPDLVAVDEAHCVSHWGHDFRPEYRRLTEALDQWPTAARLALTATATAQVQDDIAVQLALRDPLRLVGHVDRANLVFRVLPRTERLRQIQEVVARHPGEGGIVYALTRKDVEQLAESLRGHGVDAAAYHAGMPAEARRKVQDGFVNERIAVVVATVAFGMGIDRSNVRFVVHAAAPRSVEHYQQESGRAGRDGGPAECVLLWGGADFATHRFLAGRDDPSPERRRALDRQLAGIGRYCVAPVCRHRLLVEHFDQPWPAPGGADGPCGACDVCLGETEAMPDGEALLTAQKILSCVWRMESRWGAGQVIDVLRGRDTDKVQRAGHHRLTTFGLLKDAPEPAIRAWIDQLAIQDFLTSDENAEYPVLMLTEAGYRLCKGDGAVKLGRITARPAKASRRRERGPGTGSGAAADAPADQALAERLRQWRRETAAAQGVPPYVVFPDTTLTAIAAAKPATLEALREVKGIGDAKLARYGAAVLAMVAEG